MIIHKIEIESNIYIYIGIHVNFIHKYYKVVFNK